MTTVNPEYNDDCYSASNFNQLCQEFDRLNEKYLALKKACDEAEPVAYIYPPSKLNSIPLAYSAEEMKCDGVSTDGYIPAFTRPAPVIASEQKPVAYQRKWDADGEKPVKEKNANGRMQWPVRFKFLPVSKVKVLSDDIPLFTSPPNTAEIEQRVAEACWLFLEAEAEQCNSVGLNSANLRLAASALRSGKWREHL